MSSIPTSLIVVLLVAAWLVVLVPMFARRREAVPESDDGATGFRVLRRARRRRRAAGRDARDIGDGRPDDLEDQEHDMDVASTGRYDDDEYGDHDRDPDLDYDGDEFVDDGDEGSEPEPRTARVPVTVGAPGGTEDAADEWAAERSRTVVRRPGPPAPSYDGRQRQHRPGRGGFDPMAAEATRAYRYSRRRRVVLLLTLVIAAFGGAVAAVGPMYWIGVAAGAVLLVGYLAYLRRQVRIENEIRERRTARLRRARQIRPEYERDDARPNRSPYDRENLTDANDFVEETFSTRVVAPPTAGRSQRLVVDLDDDDPAFEHLETYRPAYRRQAG